MHINSSKYDDLFVRSLFFNYGSFVSSYWLYPYDVFSFCYLSLMRFFLFDFWYFSAFYLLFRSEFSGLATLLKLLDLPLSSSSSALLILICISSFSYLNPVESFWLAFYDWWFYLFVKPIALAFLSWSKLISV